MRDFWDRTAVTYDSRGAGASWLLQDGRDWACSQASGDVLEICVGTGHNLEHYPAGVRLTGVELSRGMLAIARRRAAELGMAADVCEGDAQRLELADHSFDWAVCTISLCSIPDDRRAVREVWRVLRPGGRFILVEHVRSPNLFVRAIEHVMNPISVRSSGEHVLREPLEALAAAGFTIEYQARLRLGIMERIVARKPPA